MIPGPSLFQRARRPLNILGAGILVSLTLVFASVYVRDKLKANLAQSQRQLSAQQPNLAQKQLDLGTIQTYIKQFSELKERGLVGRPDREGWVEELDASRERLNLPDTLSYTLKPPQPMDDAAAPDQAAVAPDASNPEPSRHSLDFEMRGITEPELLDLLQDYKATVHGLYRVQACRLTSPAATGLTAKCTLRFFSLPEPVKPP